MVRIASVPSSVMGSNLGGAGKGSTKRVKVVSESELELSESDPPLMPFNTKPCITIYDANQAQHFSIDLARNYLMKPTTATGHQDLDNLEKVCRHNANVARSFGILDLSKSWKMVSRLSNLLCENDTKALQNFNKKVLIYD
jgi:hypothetical protein